MSECLTCGCKLGRGNKSGYCKRHVSAALGASPEWREKHRKGIRAAIDADPARLARMRETMRANGTLPQATAARSIAAKKINLSAIGHKVLKERPECRANAGRKSSATRLAWCPPELRGLYKHLLRVSRIPAAEARQMVLETHERDMAAFRRKLLAA